MNLARRMIFWLFTLLTGPFGRIALAFIYFAVFARAVWSGISTPYYNWDQVGYVGSIISWGSPDMATAFETTKAVMKAHIPGWIYDLDFSNPLVVNSVAFGQQLIMYQLKPLYNGLSWLLHQCGVNLPLATAAVSALGMGGLGTVLYAWRPRHLDHTLWLTGILALMFLFPWPMQSLARFSTPDALCTFLVAAMAYTFLFSKRRWLFCLCCVLALLARPDALIICTFFTLYYMIAPSHHTRLSYASGTLLLLCLLAIYMMVGKFAGNLGIERWFIYSFIHKTPFPADDTDRLTFAMYWNVVSYWLPQFLLHPRTLTMMLLTAAALIAHHFRRAPGNQLKLHILCITWASLWARFIIYPGPDERYYFMYFIIILFCSGELITPYAAALWQALRRAHKEVISNSDSFEYNDALISGGEKK